MSSGGSQERGSLLKLAAVFLRLGVTAFGGPAAHLAMMRQEFVERRKWITDQEFVDLMAAANLVPGPNSTEVAIHIGMRRAGWAGLLIAGACFILPAAVMVSLIAAAYKAYGALPSAQALLYGVKPVIIAIVLQAIWGLVRSVLKTRWSIGLGLISAGLTLFGVHELAILFGAGLLLATGQIAADRNVRQAKPLALLLVAIAAVALVPIAVLALLPAGRALTHGSLFLVFVKVGSVLYGSGYVLLAFLRSELTLRLGWLTPAQLLDATAVGQFTPGPVFTTATFIGYLLMGPWGAVAATLGIFLPAFIFVALTGPIVPRLRKDRTTAAFLDGVNAAALGLMAAVSIELGRDAIRDVWTAALCAIAWVVLVRLKPNSAWLVIGGALAGIALKGLL